MTFYEFIKTMSVDQMAEFLVNVRCDAMEKTAEVIGIKWSASQSDKQGALELIKQALELDIKEITK